MLKIALAVSKCTVILQMSDIRVLNRNVAMKFRHELKLILVLLLVLDKNHIDHFLLLKLLLRLLERRLHWRRNLLYLLLHLQNLL